MESWTLNQFVFNGIGFEILIFISSVAFVVFVFDLAVLQDDRQKFSRYTVPVPEQCDPDWRGKELEDPCIEVDLSCISNLYPPKVLIRSRCLSHPPYNATALPLDAFSVL